MNRVKDLIEFLLIKVIDLCPGLEWFGMVWCCVRKEIE